MATSTMNPNPMNIAATGARSPNAMMTQAGWRSASRSVADGQVHGPDRLDGALSAPERAREPPRLDDCHGSCLRPAQVS